MMCGYVCIAFIDFMLKVKSFPNYTNLFPPNSYWNDSTGIFSITKKMKKLYCVVCGRYRKSEKPKISYLLEKTLALYIICSKCKNEDKKLFQEEESIEVLKVLGLIEKI